MAGKMSLCIVKYTYTRYVGVDIEKYTRGIYEYVKDAFGELQPQMNTRKFTNIINSKDKEETFNETIIL